MPIAPLDITFIVVYIAIVIVIGLWSAHRQTADDYLVHGRKVGLISFIASISGSWIGGGAIVAYTAYVYQFGIAALSAYIGICISLCLFGYYAPKLRHDAHVRDHITLADYFYHEVGAKAGFTTSLVVMLMVFFYIVNQFIAGSSVLASLVGWSYEAALFVSAIVVLTYLMLGGMRSVIKTDVFQFCSMVLLIFVLGIAMMTKTGVDPQLLDPRNMGLSLSFAFIVFGLFGPFANAELWQRVFVAKDDRVARFGLVGGGIGILVLGIAITLIGLAAKTAAPGIEPKDAAAYGLVHLLPPGVMGISLVVLFAAIMSSVDTLVFYLSSSLAKDFYGRFFHVTDRTSLQLLTRRFVLCVSIAGVFFAFAFRDLIAIIITVGGLSIALVPPALASFHWKIKENAVAASLIAPSIYVIVMIGLGYIDPVLILPSLFISAFVLWVWQRWLP